MAIPIPVAAAIAVAVRIIGKKSAKAYLKHVGKERFVKNMKWVVQAKDPQTRQYMIKAIHRDIGIKHDPDHFSSGLAAASKRNVDVYVKNYQNYLTNRHTSRTSGPSGKIIPFIKGHNAPKQGAKLKQTPKEKPHRIQDRIDFNKPNPKQQSTLQDLLDKAKVIKPPKNKAELLNKLRNKTKGAASTAGEFATKGIGKAKGAAGKAGGAAKGVFNHLRSGGPPKRGMLRKAGSALFNPIRNPMTATPTYAYGAWKMIGQPYSERNLDEQGLIPTQDRYNKSSEDYFDTLRDRPKLDPKTGMPFDNDINNKTELFDRYIEALQGGFNGTISDFEEAIRRQGVYNDIREQELR